MQYPDSVADFVDVLRIFPFGMFEWKTVDLPDGGKLHQAVLARDPTGAITVAAVLIGKAPRHLHPGGETVVTIAGELKDDNGGEPFVIAPGDKHVYAPGSIHEPSAEWWFGLFHQPQGSELI